MTTEVKCTKPNCDCAEIEMLNQGTEYIKSYPCLAHAHIALPLGGVATINKDCTEETLRYLEKLEKAAHEWFNSQTKGGVR